MHTSKVKSHSIHLTLTHYKKIIIRINKWLVWRHYSGFTSAGNRLVRNKIIKRNRRTGSITIHNACVYNAYH